MPSEFCARCGPGSSTSPGCCPRPRSGRGDVGKKLDRLAARQGWYTFMAGQAYAVATGKAPSKRNAEVMAVAVEQVMRWRSEVSRFAPDRLAEFDELIADALNNPAPVQKADQ